MPQGDPLDHRTVLLSEETGVQMKIGRENTAESTASDGDDDALENVSRIGTVDSCSGLVLC